MLVEPNGVVGIVSPGKVDYSHVLPSIQHGDVRAIENMLPNELPK